MTRTHTHRFFRNQLHNRRSSTPLSYIFLSYIFLSLSACLLRRSFSLPFRARPLARALVCSFSLGVYMLQVALPSAMARSQQNWEKLWSVTGDEIKAALSRDTPSLV